MPADWISLDLSETALRSARRLVDRLVELSPAHADGTDAAAAECEERGRVSAELRDAVRTARRHGTVLAALWSSTWQGQTAAASVMATITPLRDGGALDLEQVVDSVGGRGTADGTSTLLRSALVDLRAGPALRVHKFNVVHSLGRRQETELVQFYLLVPGRAALATVSFSTPTLDVAEALIELFDLMANTLRWRP